MYVTLAKTTSIDTMPFFKKTSQLLHYMLGTHIEFWTTKRLFHTKLMKKLCSTQKVCLIKVPSEYRKIVLGKKLEPPKSFKAFVQKILFRGKLQNLGFL